MKYRIPSLAVVFLATSFMRAADFGPAIDSMHTGDNHLLRLEQKIRELEKRISTLEGREAEKTASDKPRSRKQWAAIELAAAQIKAGDRAAALKTYRIALRESARHLVVSPEAVDDAFLMSYSAFKTAEKWESQGVRDETKDLCAEIATALRAIQENVPKWNPASVTYRLDRTEQLLARVVNSCSIPVASTRPAASPTLLGTSFKLRLILLFVLPCACESKDAQIELVMRPGMALTGTTTTGVISIQAGKGLERTYTWEGASRSVTLLPREERFLGSLGAYFPGDGEHWKMHNGISRGVVQEGVQHFSSTAKALEWLKQQSEYYATVYRDDGLTVSFAKNLQRRQLNVEVWQILIEGKRPRSLKGSQDRLIKVRE